MISIKIVYNSLSNKNCSTVILRKHQNQLRKSVYKEIKRACKRLGLEEGTDYTAKLSPMEINFNNGNTIYFAGGDDYETVKGMIDENTLIKMVWFEELTGWDNPEDVDQIKATFMRGNDDWFITFYSYNPPKMIANWVNAEVINIRTDRLVHSSTYLDVPVEWLGEQFIIEAETLKRENELAYRNEYLG